MKTQTKRMLTIGGLSLTGSLIFGALLRTVYESEGLPDADVHDKYYAVTGVVADLFSSLTGILFWEGSSYVMKHRGLLKDYFYDLPPDDESEYTPENDSWSKMKRYLKTGGKVLGAAAVGMATGSVAKGLYEAVSGPDIDVHLGPLVLDGTASDMLSTTAALTVYNDKQIYKNGMKPLLQKIGIFRGEASEEQIPTASTALVNYAERPYYSIQ